MHLIGRWQRVRPWWPDGQYRPPLMIDRKWSTVGPFRDEEWWQAPSGEWLAPIRGGLTLSYTMTSRTAIGPGITTGSQATVALDSAYTVASAGDAIGMRIVLPNALTLADVYIFISSYTGTAANVNDLNLQLMPIASTGLPDTGTITEAVAVNPASATGWIKSTGWTTALAAGTSVWLSAADADGNTTDYATVVSRYSGVDVAVGNVWPPALTGTTTDGWVTPALTAQSALWVMASSTKSAGQPFSNGANVTSALQKGLRIATGLPAPVKVYGVVSGSNFASITGMKIWTGSTGPSGTASDESTRLIYGSTSGNKRGALVSGTSYTLTALTPYSIMYTYGASIALAKFSIGTGADDALRRAMPGEADWYWREEVAGPAWSDDTNGQPQIQLLVDDLVSSPGQLVNSMGLVG